MKGFMNQSGLLSFFHDFQGFFFADFFGKSLGCGVACGFAERKAIQGGGLAVTGVTQQAAPLTAKTISHGNVVKFVDNLFDGLTGKNEFLGSLEGLMNRYDLKRFSIFSHPCGHGSVYGRGRMKQWRKCIIIVLDLIAEFVQQFFEQPGKLPLLLASG